MAPKVGVIAGLSEDHWRVIRFVRESFATKGRCPLVYETCRTNRLHPQELKTPFPAGYLRGACKLAGVTYAEGYLDQAWAEELAEHVTTESQEKVYEVNVRGFLVNPYAWDERFARYKAWEMKMPKLTEQHWKIIHFLRTAFAEKNLVPIRSPARTRGRTAAPAGADWTHRPRSWGRAGGRGQPEPCSRH